MFPVFSGYYDLRKVSIHYGLAAISFCFLDCLMTQTANDIRQCWRNAARRIHSRHRTDVLLDFGYNHQYFFFAMRVVHIIPPFSILLIKVPDSHERFRGAQLLGIRSMTMLGYSSDLPLVIFCPELNSGKLFN